LVVISCSRAAAAPRPSARRCARAARFQRGLQRLDQRHLRGGFLVAAARALHQALRPLLQAVEVGEHQLRLDRLGVADRVDAALDMGDVAILEAAQHMDDRVHLADVRQELVAQALALGGAAHQPGDVHEFEAGRDDLLAFADLRASTSSRGSGTATRPTFGSIVQKG
jgi:hypothetical protein